MFSCGTDDSMTPLIIETTQDSVVLSQDTTIEIFIFQNDLNIPNNGGVTITNPSKGLAIISDPNNTPNNPNDDIVIYSANPNVTGEDSFEYTICDTLNNCQTETVALTITSTSTVSFNLENVPYQTLAEYNFFQGDIKELNPNYGVVPYTLNAKLFSDYAKKKRFVWMPNNSKATYINDDVPLNFPTGAVLIKNFYYDNTVPNNETRILETRLMIKKSDGWIFANYVWNEEQNATILDLSGSFVDLQWLENGDLNSVQYRIPAGPECHTCHKVMEVSQPIGPKPRNLNLTYDYSNGPENQLDKLISVGYLENSLPGAIARIPDYNNTTEPLELRVRAYLDINCAHCHSEETHCAYRPLRFDYNDTEDSSNMGVCVDPDTDLGEGLARIVEPGDARNSVLHFRLNSLEQSYRMPLLGRTLRHVEGVNLIEEWIDNLNTDCN
tara:strand:- start:9875 stop:11194 length:1320 start_codon:yes stop_codon:yes gene_type:complete